MLKEDVGPNINLFSGRCIKRCTVSFEQLLQRDVSRGAQLALNSFYKVTACRSVFVNLISQDQKGHVTVLHS